MFDSGDIERNYENKIDVASDKEREIASKIMKLLRESNPTIIEAKLALELCYLGLEIEGTITGTK